MVKQPGYNENEAKNDKVTAEHDNKISAEYQEIQQEKEKIAIRKLIANGQRKDALTHTEINKILPQSIISTDQMESVINVLIESGVNIIENEDTDLMPLDATTDSDLDANHDDVEEDEVGKTDDPVRMYLREMGNVGLLTRDGEIEIAKRIEEGKILILKSLYTSPLATRYFIEFYNDLANEQMLLRDFIDLDMSYSKEFNADITENKPVLNDKITEKDHELAFKNDDDDNDDEDSEEDYNDDDESSEIMSFAAMESALSPIIMERLKHLSELCEQALKMQDKRCVRK